MSRWFRFYGHDVLNDPKVQRLSPPLFKAEFMAAMRGEPSAFSAFVRPYRGRDTSVAWRKLRSAIFARDDFTCTYCGVRGKTMECDHIVPLSRGGSDSAENLTTACLPCNRSKRDKLAHEWRGEHP